MWRAKWFDATVTEIQLGGKGKGWRTGSGRMSAVTWGGPAGRGVARAYGCLWPTPFGPLHRTEHCAALCTVLCVKQGMTWTAAG